MPVALTRTFDRLRSGFAQVSLGQKIMIGLLAVGLLLGSVVLFRWVNAPTYAPLFSNLASTDASAIVDQLNTDGVKYELTDGGQTVMVPKNKVYDLRLQMSGKGLPAGDQTGYALLDKQGITTSDFQQQIDYQRALEGELQKTLMAMDGVNAAVVHLALPKKEVFVTDAAKPTASVLLDLAAGTHMSAEQIQAVTHLVSSSVEGMDPEQVTVADQSGQVLSAAGTGTSGLVGANDGETQMEQDYNNQLAANAQEILDRVVGPGKAVVRVRADLNFDKTQTREESFTYKPNTPPLSSTSSTEQYKGGGVAVGGVLGPENMPNASGGSGNSTYDKKEETVNNAVDKTVRTIEGAPGSVNRLTVSVLVDQKTGGALNQSQIQSLVANAVGLNTARGDAITVAAMPFDTTAAKQAASELAQAKAADAKAAKMKWIKDGVIAFLVLLVLLVLWWRTRKRKEPVYVPEPPRMSVEQMTELDTIRAEIAAQQRAALEAGTPSDEEVARRQQVRGEIATMISDSPDEVAAMLRGWLAEEKA